MEIRKQHWFSIIFGAIVVILGAILFWNSTILYLVVGIGVLIGVTPFMLTLMQESKDEKEKEEMFIEFSRSLVESVKSGTPIVKSIINIQNKPFGVLSPHIKKLANQVALGIPLTRALVIFARDVDNLTVSRAVALIGEAERAGGDIGTVLESVATSVAEINKLKKERRAAIYNLVVQGYIIFFIFIAIVLVMQFKILPILGDIGQGANFNTIGVIEGAAAPPSSADDVSRAFFYLLIAQGLFTGLFIGKLTEGNIKAGIKHSFVLVLIGFLVYAIAKILGG